MEHEFLTPIPSVSNERFGEKGRKARRDRGEIYTMRFTDRFIKDQLLGLLLNPPKETSAEKILDASWLLFKQLAEKTSCYRELAAGYNRFCDFIRDRSRAPTCRFISNTAAVVSSGRPDDAPVRHERAVEDALRR